VADLVLQRVREIRDTAKEEKTICDTPVFGGRRKIQAEVTLHMLVEVKPRDKLVSFLRSAVEPQDLRAKVLVTIDGIHRRFTLRSSLDSSQTSSRSRETSSLTPCGDSARLPSLGYPH
jgi:hypothetical protein